MSESEFDTTNVANITNIDNSTKQEVKTELRLGNESLAVIFIFFVLLLGGIVRIFSKKYRVNQKNIDFFYASIHYFI